MREFTHADGSYLVGRICEPLACLARGYDDDVVIVEDAIGQPACVHMSPLFSIAFIPPSTAANKKKRRL